MRSSGGCGGERVERKTIEKKRRMHMKDLCVKLFSLIPKEHFAHVSKDAMTQLDYLDEAQIYIRNLKERVEKLTRKRSLLESDIRGIGNKMNSTVTTGSRLPIVDVRCHDAKLEVVLVSDLSWGFKFHQVLGVLEEEGAEVVAASFSQISNKIFHTIHCHEFSPRIGLEASRVSERLKELVVQTS